MGNQNKPALLPADADWGKTFEKQLQPLMQAHLELIHLDVERFSADARHRIIDGFERIEAKILSAIQTRDDLIRKLEEDFSSFRTQQNANPRVSIPPQAAQKLDDAVESIDDVAKRLEDLGRQLEKEIPSIERRQNMGLAYLFGALVTGLGAGYLAGRGAQDRMALDYERGRW